MKKLIPALLCALLLLPFCPHTARAEATSLPVIEQFGIDVPARLGSVSVPVTVENGSELTELSLTVTYPAALTYSSMLPALQGDTNALELEADDARYVKCVWKSNGNALTERALVASFVFSFPSDAEIGTEYEISVSGEGKDADGNVITVSAVSGKVTLTDKVIYGDANFDGKINAKDIAALMRRSAGFPVSVDVTSADVNLDKKVNAKDVSAIMKVLAGWNSVRLGHSDITEVLVEANCQHTGKIRLTCTSCGDSVEIATSKTDHDYSAGKCTVCGAKSPDYAVIAYCDYLKHYGKFDADLRGYALYETLKYDGYTVFSSNICDSKTGELCIFGVVTYSGGVTCSFSLETSSVMSEYVFYYDCSLNGKLAASATGVIKGDGKVVFTDFTGDAKSKSGHITMAQTASDVCLGHTNKLMKASGLGIGMKDLGIAVK